MFAYQCPGIKDKTREQSPMWIPWRTGKKIVSLFSYRVHRVFTNVAATQPGDHHVRCEHVATLIFSLGLTNRKVTRDELSSLPTAQDLLQRLRDERDSVTGPMAPLYGGLYNVLRP